MHTYMKRPAEANESKHEGTKRSLARLRETVGWFRANEAVRKLILAASLQSSDLHLLDDLVEKEDAADQAVGLSDYAVRVARAAQALAESVEQEVKPALDLEVLRGAPGMTTPSRTQLRLTRSALEDNVGRLRRQAAALEQAVSDET